MKKTARRILSAILMSSLLFTSGISAIAATDAPAAVTEQTETVAPASTTSNLPLERKVTDEASSPASAKEAAPAPAEAPIVLGETRATINEAPVEVVTIEETETPLAPKAETTLSSGLPLETKLTEEVEATPEEVTEEELSPAMTISSTTYSGVTVEVSADEGVLPSDAHLFVAEIKSHAGKQTAENALGNTDIEYDDYMVLDIQIRNGQAEEIEPDGNVRVNIMMDAARLPEDADASTLEIQHLAENANGEIKAVETVADNGNATDGSVGINGDNVEAEFTVGSFSLFTLTWKASHSEGAPGLRMYFDAYDINGNSLSDAAGLGLVEYGGLGSSQNVWFRTVLTDYGLNTIHATDPADNTYKKFVFDHAEWKNRRIGGIKNSGTSGIMFVDESWNFDYGLTEYYPAAGTVKDLKENPVKLFYKAVDNSPLTPVKTIDSTSMGIDMHLFKFNSVAENRANGRGNANDPMFHGWTATSLYYKTETDYHGSEGTYGNQYGRTPSVTQLGKDKALTDGSDIDWELKFARGQIWQGLTSPLIPEGEEFPTVELGTDSAGNTVYESLGEWFNPAGGGKHQQKAQEVNHLFRHDIYESTGYFYYGSDENGVELANKDAKQTNFYVYDEIVTARRTQQKVDEAFFYQRGNFLPYNTIDKSNPLATTKLDMAGNPLDPVQDKEIYGKTVYGFKEAGAEPTYYFGMNVEASFYQTIGGLSEKTGDPMMFEFNGDDDFWLYLDDVLILDLGGNHDAQNGFINFHTGDVYYTDNGSFTVNCNPEKLKNGVRLGNVKSNISTSPDGIVYYKNYKGQTVELKYDGHTTIREMFNKAYGKAAVDAMDIWDASQPNTFAPGTFHTMKIYYMEHCGGASNLRMMFNLPVVPKSDLTVSKTFVENGKPKEVPDDFEGVFELYQVDTSKNEYTFVSQVVLDKTTANDGTFTRTITDSEGNVIDNPENYTGAKYAKYEYKFEGLPIRNKYVIVEKIYRSDIGYLNTMSQIAKDSAGIASAGTLSEANGKKLLEAPVKARAMKAIETGREPVFHHISEVVEIKEKGAVPSVLEVENHYQTTLTIEKHVHSQNEDDKNTAFEFRLYLKNTDGTPYTEPLGKPVKIGSLEWQQANGQDDLVYPAPGKNYYEFTLKDTESITLAVPNGIRYLVAENVGGEFRVFRPFLNKEVVLRDDNDDIVFDANNEVLWQDAVKLIPETDKDKELEGFKTTPEDVLTDDTKITFINERQIVRTGVTLNSAPFMVMLSVVFMAAAGLCVKYLRKKAEEEGELFD